MKYLNVFFALDFVAPAALQRHDPDPLLWMAPHLGTGFLCMLAFRSRLRRGQAVFAVAACMPGAARTWPEHFEGPDATLEGHRSVEKARESIGPSLYALLGVFVLFMQRKHVR